jgi:hypothetical protein
MSRGYYFSKSDYDKDLNLRLKLDEELKEIMQPDIQVPTRKLRSIDQIVADPQLLESEVRKDLGKIMLEDDINKTISFLKSKDELGLFFRTYDQFLQKMGKPSRLGFYNFEINWGKFDKEDTVKDLKEVDRINTMERKLRIILEKFQQKPIKSMVVKEQIGKILAFNKEVDRLKQEEVDEESIRWDEMLEKFKKLKEELELEEAEEAESSIEATLAPSEFVTSTPEHSQQKLKDFKEYFKKAKIEIDKTSLTQNLTGNYTMKKIKEQLIDYYDDKNMNTSIRNINRGKIGEEVDFVLGQLTSGSGFNKKRRMRIIEGSIEAGNTNPELIQRLWNLKYRK